MLGRSPVGIAGYASAGLAVVFVVIAFATPYWLEADPRLPQMKFDKLGLWQQCFRSIFVPSDPFLGTYFTGCRWLFNPWTTDYDKLREELILRPFFIAVQVFFTFCLIFSILGCIMVFMYACCVAYDRRVCMLRSISVVFFLAALCGTIAVITFGARGDGRDWMPYPDHNYLSWSFGLAVVGTFFAWVAAILFWIESNRTRRRQEKEESYAMHSQSKA